MKTRITLRKATLNDLDLLRYWDKQPHIRESVPEEDYWEWEKDLKQDPEWREQLIAELDSLPIGFIQIIDPLKEETHYWGDVESNQRAIDIWIGEKDDLGKGYGTIMMRLTLNKCFKPENIKSVLIDPLESNTQAHRFYERLGFEFLENRRFGNDRCRVYILDRQTYSKTQEQN